MGGGFDKRPGAVVEAVYTLLMESYGPRGWWPVTGAGADEPRYTGGPETEAQRFEVAAGAVLTQNTSWKNAAKGVVNLLRAGLLDPEKLLSADEETLSALIRPSGYYNQKGLRLRRLAGLFAEREPITREGLLGLNGIGPETADSIMLYSFGKQFFVVDAYTRRIFSRIGILTGEEGYEQIRDLFETNLPGDVLIYQEYHALIVEHGKRFCGKKPVCEGCPLETICGYGGGPAGGVSGG